MIFSMPELIGIGVGPGDPDLLTVKAVKAIQRADTIMCPASNEDRPSIALSVITPLNVTGFVLSYACLCPFITKSTPYKSKVG